MLSNPLHRFSPYHNIQSSNLMSNGHVPQAPLHPSNMEHMGQNPHYGIQQLQQVGATSPHLARSAPQPRPRQHPYGASGRSSSTSGPVRRRISRACDQCNQLRTKCDGQHPCAHCTEFGLGCEYVRERKKRGKASRKDLAQQAAAQAASSVGGVSSGHKSDSGAESSLGTDGQSDAPSSKKGKPKSLHCRRDSHVTAGSENRVHEMGEDAMSQHPVDESLGSFDEMTGHDELPRHDDMPRQPPHLTANTALDRDEMGHQPTMDLNEYDNSASTYDRPPMAEHLLDQPPYGPGSSSMSNYPDIQFGIHDQGPASAYNNNSGFRMGNSPLRGYGLGASATSPGWGVSMSSPPAQFHSAPIQQPSFNPGHLRYPVLEPLIPHLGIIMPISLACDLIELYFASSSSAQMHPMSPYVLGFVFRKRAFLHQANPRRCQPALLASMLWVAAQTSDAPLLTSVPSARSKTCQKLLELTVGLLKPLIHTPSGEASPAASPAADGVALGGLGVALPGTISMDALTGESGAFGAAGNLDDVITYIHLATVVSASEYKGASIRWWNAAWSLARELKLGRELPPNAPQANPATPNESNDLDEHDRQRNRTGFVTEEEREERRRIWWLVYIVDRHLALCYNRPLFLLDLECDGLLQPVDDTAWQSGEFGAFSAANADPNTDPTILGSMPEGSTANASRVRGLHFECRGHSIFGYFLPLMTILGETVDLHHARNHPRFGLGFRSAREWDNQAAEITRHLEAYEQSLKKFEQQHLAKIQEDKADGVHAEGEHHGAGTDIGTPSVHSVHSVHTNSSNRMTESDIQTRIVIAYGTHVTHVLHVLLAGKWDPINLLDDNDLWISSEGFLTSTSHAVSAAEAINQILEYDPGLEFMPFFFGIYLLQGSFLLLLIADKLQVEASPSVVRACETIVRAHEACVVTLSTEYQRNFSKVMRSALAQVRGRVPEDLHEQHQRRRELLALYRWTGDGTGLAL